MKTSVWMTYLIVGLAGSCGALSRYGVSLLFMEQGRFPTHTFVANMTGCLLLGVVLTVISLHKDAHPWWKAGVGTGFLGSYTTFSTFSYETVNLITVYQDWGIAIGYVLASIWCGLLLAWVGYRFVILLSQRART